MYILDELRLDKAHRLNISSLFKESPVMPEEVSIVFDTESKCLLIEDAYSPWLQDDPDWVGAITRKLDCKGRFCLPRWMREEFGDAYLVVNYGRYHALLPKKYYNKIL